MSVSPDEMKTNIIWVSTDETIQQVRNRIGDDLDDYVVVTIGDKFYLFQLQHLNEAVLNAYGDAYADHLLTYISAVPDFLSRYETKALDNGDSGTTAKRAQKTAATLKTTEYKGVVITQKSMLGTGSYRGGA